jgi:hypothetical protein
MNTAKVLIPVGWTLWGALFLLLIWGFWRVLTERSHSPEMARGSGIVVIGFLLIVVAGLGVWLAWATRHGSSGGLITVTLLLAYPITLLALSPIVGAWKTWRLESEMARVGDFREPASRALAEKIQLGDLAGLRRLLGTGPLPAGHDRAGHDLLAFATVVVRDRKGDPEIVRILLEAGADPRKSGMPGGGSLLHFMVINATPGSVEVIRLLLEHGADPNAKDPQWGATPMADAGERPELVRLLVEAGANVDQLMPGGESILVRFVGLRQWESALFLIGKGAKLDVSNSDGLSLDYYLKDWKESVYGEHPEGWDRVRKAIQARREGESVSERPLRIPPR